MNEKSSHSKRKRDQYLHYFLITWNNPKDTFQAIMEQLQADYAVGQVEKGNSGTTHIQALVYFKSPRYSSDWKGIPAHYEGIPAQDATRVRQYCTKEDTRVEGPFTYGAPPSFCKEQQPRSKGTADITIALQSFMQGRIKEVEPNIIVNRGRQLVFAASLLQTTFHTPDVRGLWISGPPGTGKSTFAREYTRAYSLFFTAECLTDELYIKPQNKWWDNYANQAYTLLEDLDTSGACLSHYLKIWADKFGFHGEIKGSTVPLRYILFIVTSNYLPSELWEDSKIVEAISRRFKFITFQKLGVYHIGTELGKIPKIPKPEHYLSQFIE